MGWHITQMREKQQYNFTMNHIKNVEIKNFKSIRRQTIDDCRRVNVFIGYPNVGKSNILEVLSCLSYINNEFYTNISKLCRFENYSDLFNYGDISEPSYIEFNSSNRMIFKYKSEERLHIELHERLNKEWLKWVCVFGIDIEKGDSSIKTPQTSRRELLEKRDKDLNELKVFKYTFLDNQFDKTISAIHLDSPFGENLFEVIQNSFKIKEAFSELIKPYGFKLLFDKSSKKLKLFKELSDESIYEFSFSQIADTLQKLIFHLTACISNKDSVLLFEEPEAHMFPPYISKLTSNIIYDENNNQYFIATHSPFVLNDFMEDMDKEDLSIYAVGLKDGETTIRKINNEEITEIYQYGIDLFFNLENYLKDVV